MGKNTCKLCSRRFASPRALAGHMRSHYMAAAKETAATATAAAAAAAAAAKQQISSASSASTSIAAADEEVGLMMTASTNGLRENPKRSLGVADVGFSDRESETESTPPQAKRVNAAGIWGEPEASSSLSEVATPEDVALSLMMLSRDSWPSGVLAEKDGSDDRSDDGYAPPAPPRRAPAPVVEKRTQFQCVACKKVFRSYQALGGHRASNVRGGRGGCCAPPVAPPAPPPQPQPPLSPLPEHRDGGEDEDMNAKQQPRECPHCGRVFSGQALGEHMRFHVCASSPLAGTGTGTATASTTSAATPASPTNSPSMIDLNVAPQSEEVEHSAVSDPRFNPGA
ncbi:Zinc finger protein ZAT4 [Zea mays]|jgi:hypothetical protein|uniref:Cys2/His2 zinc-finger transcription factor n=2 Tax=Zea mays TaxID=4577 RepID=K7UHQ6_MAIZE|nr:cys2/His2 zinc-finger transcription factor [Zea mays]AQK54104.1 Cys2/His2 zinc-finger transcription factor [Zea mays]PWZ28186.1 Zinc finger protein ZAT4 [Zea mays]